MCGIAAFVSINNDCIDYLNNSLSILSQRGYDSWGYYLANTYDNKSYIIHKDVGEYKANTINNNYLKSHYNIGMAHTRWATNGIVNFINAHPHIRDNIVLVHNGILSNSISKLDSDSAFLTTELTLEKTSYILTLTKYGPLGAVVFYDSQTQTLYAYRDDGPLYAAIYPTKILISSQVNTFPNNKLINCISLHTGTLYYINVNKHNIIQHNITGRSVPCNNQSTISSTTMFDEIKQQINLIDTIPYIESDIFDIKEKLLFIGCGSSYYAGQYVSHRLKLQNTFVLRPNELKYGHLNKDTKIVFITQSGETKDILKSIEYIRNSGKIPIENQYLVTNNIHSSCGLMFNQDRLIDIQAGYENSVAATKTFWLTIFALLYVNYNYKQDIKYPTFKNNLSKLFEDESLLDIQAKAEFIKLYKNILIIGSDGYYNLAQELALKFKEVCYIHAEAIDSDEIKHGPIALIDENVLTISLGDNKKAENEIRARDGVIMTFNIGSNNYSLYDELETLMQIQLVVYYVAMKKGLIPERPRNLSKTVTV